MASVDNIDQRRVAFSSPPVSDRGTAPPLLVLAAGKDVDTMPRLGMGTEWHTPSALAGWFLHVTLMFCVLDNEPHVGFFIGPLMPHDLDMRLAWARSFDRHGGAWVVLEAGVTLTGGHPIEAGTEERWSGLRGGFVRAMQRS